MTRVPLQRKLLFCEKISSAARLQCITLTNPKNPRVAEESLALKRLLRINGIIAIAQFELESLCPYRQRTLPRSPSRVGGYRLGRRRRGRFT